VIGRLKTMAKRYTLFDHTADLGVEVYGKTAPELFANASFALFDVITDLSAVETTKEKKLVVEGSGWEDLFVNYLREILYLFNGEGFLLTEYSILTLEPFYLEATVKGEPFDPARHSIKTEIKAVTYHQVSVREDAGKWTGRVIFDV
jgi:SHS2 domain-containing protein